MRHKETEKVYYRLTVKDAKGRIEKRTHWRVCHSWVEQWIQGWRMFSNSAAEAGVTDILGAVHALRDPGGIAPTQTFGYIVGGVGADDVGIVIGTDNTPVTITDNALGAQIANGAGGGQMNYLGSTVGTITVVVGSASFIFSRTFNNASGAAITVREVGAYCAGRTTTAANVSLMILRDVSADVVVNNTRTIVAEYLVRVAV